MSSRNRCSKRFPDDIPAEFEFADERLDTIRSPELDAALFDILFKSAVDTACQYDQIIDVAESVRAIDTHAIDVTTNTGDQAVNQVRAFFAGELLQVTVETL